MEQHKITNPDELLSLTPEQLFQRVKPLLRKGGLCASSAQLARVKQNLSSACWELGQQWRADPHLAGREVAFSENLATKLSNALRALDRKQNPHLYDIHHVYQPDREPLEFDELDGKYFPFRPVSPPSPEALTAATWAHSLEAAARNGRIAQPSGAALIQNVKDVENGKTKSPYKLARTEGLSTTDARYHPATATFIAIRDFIADYSATAAAAIA